MGLWSLVGGANCYPGGLNAFFLAACLQLTPTNAAQPAFEFERGDHICLVGNALAERMQHHGWLEAAIQARLPLLELSFRNLGFSADEVSGGQRTAGFGSPDEHLTRCEADIVLAFFGFNESFAGATGLAEFERDLGDFIAHQKSANYSGDGAPTLVLFSPIAFENLKSPSLPVGKAHNARLELYSTAMARIAARENTIFIDLLAPTRALYAAHTEPLTINGAHLTSEGNRLLADVIALALLADAEPLAATTEESKRDLHRRVLAKNLLWFNRYRATDGYNVYGGRSSLEYDGVTNYRVLQRELEVLVAECERADREIWAVASGEDPAGVGGPSGMMSEVPPLIPVETNKPGTGAAGAHEFLSAQAAIDEMDVLEGCRVELFADEERFPNLVNPVQMSWDTRGRLWVACWPTYPHWEPGKPMNDKLLIFEDTDGDGRADVCKTFAGNLHNPTGFEFWNGGVFVGCAPDLLFLKDLDGDDRADSVERVLHGLSSGDTHHSANSFVLGPCGGLYFQEGTFHMSQIESIYGPLRNHNGCVWRFEPRTWRVERYVPYNFANPHGHVFDRWGQDFVTDGTGNVNYFALAFSGFIQHPLKHPGIAPFFQQRSRPAGATEILSSAHFPAENQGNYLIANVIGFQGIFQYSVQDDGAGFGAEEQEPILQSRDPRFRPVDIEVGPDGALYILDWQNPLIGHMQHHLRDPSRDNAHGRIYRVLHETRPLVDPVPIHGRPLDELVGLLGKSDDRVRYRTRIELSARDSVQVVRAAKSARGALAGLAEREEDSDSEHFLLELLWLQAQHDVLDEGLLEALLNSSDERARAASVRVLRSLRQRSRAPLDLLRQSIADPSARVRMETIVALSFFQSAQAAEIALLALDAESDSLSEYALTETLRALEPHWRDALTHDADFAAGNSRGLEYILARTATEKLAGLRPSSELYRELLGRHGLDSADYSAAAGGLAAMTSSSAEDEILAAIGRADARTGGHVDHLLMGLFGALRDFPATSESGASLAQLSKAGQRHSTRCLATAARIEADGELGPAWRAALGSVAALGDLLEALPYLSSPRLAEEVFESVLRLTAGLPGELAASAGIGGKTHGRYIRIELPGARRTLTLAEVQVFAGGENIAAQGSASQSSVAWSGVASRAIDGNTSGVYGDSGQTHTIEDLPDPWWELDLGTERSLDEVRVWNRTESDGRFSGRLAGFVLRILDGQRRTVYEETPEEQASPRVALQVASPALRVRRAAVRALGALGVQRERAVQALLERFDEEALRASVVSALAQLAPEKWSAASRESLAAILTRLFAGDSAEDFGGPEGRQILALADSLVPLLDPDTALALFSARRGRGPQVQVLRPVPDALLFDRREFTVVAGRPVELVFSNTDLMPHNLVVTAPGALARVGLAAEADAAADDAWERGFIPETDEVLFHTGLLQPGESEVLAFVAPEVLGDYPFVCTFPGHWVRMNGVMHVIASLPELLALPGLAPEPAANAASQRAFVKNWTRADFPSTLAAIDPARSAAGRRVLETASCLSCHRVADEGGLTGPALTEVQVKYTPGELLQQILEPSALIAEGYAAEIFLLKNGQVVAGPVLDEDAHNLYIQDDPYRDDLLILPREEFASRRVSQISSMPSGLLSTFSAEEILDLVAYLKSLGVKSGDD